MAAIAPRRTGAVVFGARVLSIVTGLLFILMVTHALSTSQFGLLEVITDIVVFSTYPLGVINFWVSRDTARGKVVGRSAVTSNMFLSILGVAIFVVLAFVRGNAVASSVTLFAIALMLVPISYWYSTVNALLSVHFPQGAGYTLLTAEGVKLLSAYLLLYVARAGLPGVLASLAVSNLAQGALASYLVKDTFAGSFSFGPWKEWVRSAWLPALNSTPYILGIADTYVAFLVTGGYTLTGYYQAAFTVAAIVGYCGYLSYALYPLLLRGGAERMIGLLFDFTMMLGIPMAVGVAALSPQLLYLLSKKYIVTSTPLEILAFSALVVAFSSLIDTSLMGKDTSDLVEGSKFRSLLRGNLFFVPMANLLYGALYITSVAAIAHFGTAASLSYPEIIDYWAAAQLGLAVLVALIKLRRLGLSALAGVKSSLLYYIVSAVVMGAAVYEAAPLLLNFSMTAVNFGLRLAVIVVLGGAVYFGFLAAVDAKARERLINISGAFLP
ncbi:MAG: hypothetical protein JRN57_04755 [Nitrososphaerota archaeon]|nr:hypothetical protein [Nitrososphaerota archaeon]